MDLKNHSATSADRNSSENTFWTVLNNHDFALVDKVKWKSYYNPLSSAGNIKGHFLLQESGDYILYFLLYIVL